MPGRQSRQKSRDSSRANRARCVLTASPTHQARSRSRSEVSLSDSIKDWTKIQWHRPSKIYAKVTHAEILSARSSEPRLEWSQIRQRTTLCKRMRLILRTLIQLGTKWLRCNRPWLRSAEKSDNSTTGSTAAVTSAYNTTMPPTTVFAPSLSGTVRVPIDSLSSVESSKIHSWIKPCFWFHPWIVTAKQTLSTRKEIKSVGVLTTPDCNALCQYMNFVQSFHVLRTSCVRKGPKGEINWILILTL